jgi:hypothetical protein
VLSLAFRVVRPDAVLLLVRPRTQAKLIARPDTNEVPLKGFCEAMKARLLNGEAVGVSAKMQRVDAGGWTRGVDSSNRRHGLAQPVGAPWRSSHGPRPSCDPMSP